MSTSKNPLYETCLLKLISDASSDHTRRIYETCLESLRKFPLPIRDPTHCRILEGFDKSVVKCLQFELEILSTLSQNGSGSSKDLIDVSLSPIPHQNGSSKRTSLERSLSPVIDNEMTLHSRSPIHLETSPLSLNDRDSNEIVIISSSEDEETKLDSISSAIPKRTQEIDLLDNDIEQDVDSIFDAPKRSKKSHTVIKPKSLKENDDILRTDTLDNIDKLNATSKTRKKTKEYVPKIRSGAYAILITLYKRSQADNYVGYMSKSEIFHEAQSLSDESFKFSKGNGSSGSGAKFYYTAWSGSTILHKHNLIRSWSNPKKYAITDSGKDLARRLLSAETSVLNENNSRVSGLNVEMEPMSSLKYCYVKDVFTLEETDDQNNAEMDIDDDVWYLIKCRKESLCNSGKRFRIYKELDDGLFVLAYLLEADALETSPVSRSNDLVTLSQPSSYSQTTTTESASDLCDFRFWLNIANKKTERPILSTPSSTNVDLHVPLFQLQHYEIILLVDTSETQGSKVGGKETRREITVKELLENGVDFEKRNLNLGDFLWIAKEKNPISGTPRELVLPYIIERKRMDDLKRSIMDQRYAEQKFRLSNSGIKNKFYLIEEFGNSEKSYGGSKGISPSALEQAMANTAVQEGFFIRRTKSQKESMAFLTAMTKTLLDKYRNQTLNSCKKDDIDNGKIRCFDTTLLTYEEFNKFSRKNKNFIVKDIFLKMLLQQKGLTPGMAWSITERYPTPRILAQAYNDKSEKEVELLLQAIKYDGGRKIPVTVSRTLGILFSNDKLM